MSHMGFRHIAAASLLVIALAGCGSRQDLTAKPGDAMPVAAYGADRPATPEEMLEPSTQAQPSRDVELLRRSERREEDPFDLPPED